MDDASLNRCGMAAAVVAIAASLGSLVVPLGGQLTALLAVVGLVALAAGLHCVRPPQRDLEGSDDESQTRYEEGPVQHAVGAASAALAGLVGLLIAAAIVARIAQIRYLGSNAIFLAEHFTIVTGPLVATLGAAVLMASRGNLTIRRTPTMARRITTVVVLSVLSLVALLVALGAFAQPWQAPYFVAIAGVIAWMDAVKLAGLPSMGEIGHWLERGETEESRFLVRALARFGNGTVLVLAVAGLALYALDRTTPALLVEATAAVLLTITTHAAANLTRALPAELGDELASADDNQSRLELLGIGPLLVSLIALILTGIAFVGLTSGGGTKSLLEAARPSIGAALAVLAGVNLARSGLPRFSDHGPVRRAISTTTISVLSASLFFSLLIELGIMTGPITDAGLGVLFNYATVLAVAVFVLARGLYPIPGLEAEEKPGEEEETRVDHESSLERSLVAVYAASGVFVIAAIGLLAMAMFGDLGMALPQSGEGRNAAYLATVGVGVMLILGLAVVYFRSRQLDTPHGEEVEFERSYTAEEVMRLTVLGISGTIAFVLGLLGVLVAVGQLESIGGLTLESKHSTDFFVFAILIGIGPAGYLHNRERKRIQAIDQRLPEFLRDLAESQRTGMTLTQAVITASKGNYGALTPEIKKMAAQIEWGVSFDRALRSFAERVDTPLVQRTVSLVIEASNSGGDVMEVLEAAADDAREIQMIKQERKSGMQIYVMIIYIAFLVFLGVIGILNVKFMPEVAKAVSGASGVTVGSITFQDFEMQTFQTLFFHASVIQGLGGGFVAGSMEEGKPVAGLKHAFAMTIIAYVTFRFFLGG